MANLYTIDARQERELVCAAQKVLNTLLFDGVYSNIAGYVLFSSQPGNDFENHNLSMDRLVRGCKKYRSCVEDAVRASELLYEECGHLSQILNNIIHFVVTRENGNDTLHAALMLKWVAQNKRKAIVLDVELARRVLIHPVQCRRQAVSTDMLDYEKYEQDGSGPDRVFDSNLIKNDIVFKVMGQPPTGTFETVEKDLLIKEVSVPVWKALRLMLDGRRLRPGEKERPFVLFIRVKRLEQLGKGLPGISLVTTSGSKFSIVSPVRFIIGRRNITMQFHTPPRLSHPVSEGWQKRSLKFLSTEGGLSAILSFLDQQTGYAPCVRNALEEASLEISEVIEQLRSVIVLIGPPTSEIPDTTATLDSTAFPGPEHSILPGN